MNATDHKQADRVQRWRRHTTIAIGLLALALVLLGLQGILPAPQVPEEPAPTPTSWPMTSRFRSPEYGVNLHLWWDPWAAIRRDWPLVKEAGFEWAKHRLAWVDVEARGPGLYDWYAADRIVGEAAQAGVNLVFRLDYPPAWAVPQVDGGSPLPVQLDAWQDFCTVVATRYRGQVRGYQVWNEPNLAREWGGHPPDPAGYVRLLQACYIGIKSGDPDALVISAGLAPTGSGLPEALPDTVYLEAMYEAGARPFFDLLGLHAPGYKAPPEIAPEVVADPEQGYGGHPSFCFRHAETMRAIMERYGDGDKQVAILEFGWHTNTSLDHPDYAWFGVSPEEQADYLVRALRYAEEHWAPWVGPMFVWNIPDPHWTPDHEEFWWGIVDPFWWGFDGDHETWAGGSLRPAYEALKSAIRP